VPESPALLALLADPARVATLAPEAALELLDALGLHEGRCRLVRDLLTARLRNGAPGASDGQATEQGAVTQEEAAAAYRMPLRTLRRLTRNRLVPSYQLGRNRMVRRADLDRYLARCRAQGVAIGGILDV